MEHSKVRIEVDGRPLRSLVTYTGTDNEITSGEAYVVAGAFGTLSLGFVPSTMIAELKRDLFLQHMREIGHHGRRQYRKAQREARRLERLEAFFEWYKARYA